jgi:hypothetical protein
MMAAAREVERIMSPKLFVLGSFVIAISFGCQGQIAPLSAQAGSTIVIPVSGDPNIVPMGYGGTEGEDYQRGTLVYQLDEPGGFELVTRASSAVAPVPNTTATVEFFAPKRQVVSVVDIPTNAPLGSHTLHVKRRRIESGSPVDYTGPEYNGEITILPNEVEFDVGGTPETSVGAPTPSLVWECPLFNTCGWHPRPPSGAIPMPELRLTTEDEVNSIGAIELEVEYPASVIDIFDVYEVATFQTNHLAVVWYDNDETNGVLRIGASATSPIPVITIGIAFQLVDGETEILDLDDVAVSVEEAWDLEGAAISSLTMSKDVN